MKPVGKTGKIAKVQKCEKCGNPVNRTNACECTMENFDSLRRIPTGTTPREFFLQLCPRRPAPGRGVPSAPGRGLVAGAQAGCGFALACRYSLER